MNWVVGLIVIFAVGLFFGFYANGKPTDIQVNVEYTNGILTATGILFGIWTIVLGRKPTIIKDQRDATKKFQIENYVKEEFFFSLFFLVMDVTFLAFTAVNAFSPLVTLLMVTSSFVYTALFLSLSLYYIVFKEIS